MEPLRKKLENELDGCSRIVSGTFPVPGWTPHMVKARKEEDTPLPVHLYLMDRIHDVADMNETKSQHNKS